MTTSALFCDLLPGRTYEHEDGDQRIVVKIETACAMHPQSYVLYQDDPDQEHAYLETEGQWTAWAANAWLVGEGENHGA